MAAQVLDAYENESIALVEAGTGIGKSLAYLYPAVHWALKHKEKTVIATNTIALQEQLLHKDIPLLLKLLGEELKVCLVKGMGNYVCLRKLKENQEQLLLLSSSEDKEMQAIEMWVDKYHEGSFSNFPFSISNSTWEKVAVESESCTHVHCNYYKECFFFKERKKAADSQLLIVNHHLLLADLQRQLKAPHQEAILPYYQRVVIDEVHHFEKIALESFSQTWSRLDLLRTLARLHSEMHPERSLLLSLSRELPQPLQALEIDLPAQRRLCHDLLEVSCVKLRDFQTSITEDRETKRRFTEEVCTHPAWKEILIPELLHLAKELQRLSQMLSGLGRDLEKFKETPVYPKLMVPLVGISVILQKCEDAALFLEQFVKDEPKEKRVRWIEKTPSNVTLVDASLDVSSLLNEHLFSKQKTSVLCSATVATARSFSFIKKRLGLLPQTARIQEGIFESPFDYQTRTLFAVPVDFPAPSHPDFFSQATQAMKEIIEISRGSVFLLFTSYEMLEQCHRVLSQVETLKRFPFLKQKELPRHLLLEKFKKKEGSVLFATDSFWEGVDVSGEALRCVVIVKLPFSVPSDPLYEAYALSLEQEGLDPFSDYSVPQAVIRFKQGFGRLMRQKNDRGCVVCLDNRVIKKSYGNQFLKSLPPCQLCFAKKEEMYSQMREFYKKTSFETCFACK